MDDIAQLEARVRDIIERLDQSASKVVDSILDAYRLVCRGNGVAPGLLRERPRTKETVLRLRFECLCFAVFFTCLGSEGFLKDRPRLVLQHFDGALGTALLNHCRTTRMSELRESGFLAATRKKLDPIDLLEEYRVSWLREHGSEIERFGKRIGKALDPPHYPTLELIGGEAGLQLVRMVPEVLFSVLSSS